MIGTVLYDLPTRVCEFGEHEIQEHVSFHIADIVAELEVHNAPMLFRQYMAAYVYGHLTDSVDQFIDMLVDECEEDPLGNDILGFTGDYDGKPVICYRTISYCSGTEEAVNRAIEKAAKLFIDEHANGATGLASVVCSLFPGKPARLVGDTYDTMVVSCILG